MKKQVLLLISFSILTIITCNEVGTTYDQLIAIKTVSQRVSDLKKTKIEIKNSEDPIALVREEHQFLEYEYPVRKDESYVIFYRFDDTGCFEIKLDTYLNNQIDAQKVINLIIKDLEVNTTFGLPKKSSNFYRWENLNSEILIELDVQNIKRGHISLNIFSTIFNNLKI